MSELHPVETAWRRFRKNEHNLSLFRTAHARKPIVLQGLRSVGVLSDWPPGVVLSAAPAVRVMNELAHLLGLGANARTEPDLFASYANTMHAWAAYRESKTIFRVEPYLAERLSRTPC